MTAATAPPERSLDEVPLRYKFFQASAFFPMPVVLIGTVGEGGAPHIAPYSLCFPQPTAGEHAMLLICREDSNTAQNIARSGRLTINFIPDRPPYLDNCKVLGRPGPAAEKMAHSIFTLVPDADDLDGPVLVAEAVQVFDCTLDRSRPFETPHGDHHFLLQVTRIRMQPRWREALERGRGFPRLPVDYGFRAPTSSWLSRMNIDFEGPALRPRFVVEVEMGVSDAIGALRRALTMPEQRVAGAVGNELIQVTIPDAESHFWSPQLEIKVEEADSGARIRGRIGPHPHVWTMFLAMHAFVAFAALGGLMFGLSQWSVGEDAWALWALPVAAALHLFIAGAAFVGQGLGSDHVMRLREFVHDALSH